MSDRFELVGEREFEDFLKSYPRKLERDVSGISEPPTISWNDFERAPYWPDSVVATKIGDRHRILRDINSPVPDSGKRDTDTQLLDKFGVAVREGDVIEWHSGGFEAWDADGNLVMTPIISRETVLIRDKGTKYERWSMESCFNHLRGCDFEIVDPAQ